MHQRVIDDGNTRRCMSCYRLQCTGTCPSSLYTDTWYMGTIKRYIRVPTAGPMPAGVIDDNGNACQCMSCYRRQCTGTCPLSLNTGT